MPDRALPVPPSGWFATHGWIRRHRPSEQALFSGTYGLVLTSALVAALSEPGERSDPGTDLVWLLLTVVTSAAAHGYAHVIAHRAADDRATVRKALRTVWSEWPLIAAGLPTMGMLLAAVVGWWPESEAVNAALVLNTVALFIWGAWAARGAGRGRAASCRAGSLDMVIGLVIIGANAVIK